MPRATSNAEKLIEESLVMSLFDIIEPSLERYPAINPKRFRERVLAVLQTMKSTHP